MDSSSQQPKKEGGTNDEDATKSAPTPPAVSAPTNLNCSFCDKQLSLDKHKKCTCKTTFYCMNSGCQKEHWKVHKPEHQQIRKAMKLLEKAAKDDTKSGKNTTSSPSIHQESEDEEDCPTTPPEVVDPNTITCSTCGTPQTENFKLKKCACLITQYCNKQCQKKHRKQHKKECTYRVKKKKKKKNEQNNMKKDGMKDGKKEMPIQEAEDKEDCPICCDALPKLSLQIIRMTCCGKGLHIKCHADLNATECLTLEQKMTCIMCRTKELAQGSKKDIERLRNWIKKGKAWAMSLLAVRYRDGLGVKQSDKKMIELYEMAAKRGHATAQYNLGVYYDEGICGLTQSDQRAIEFFTLAAEQGYVRAQANVGIFYLQGKGVEQSITKAKKWITRAAAQGHRGAIAVIKKMDAAGM